MIWPNFRFEPEAHEPRPGAPRLHDARHVVVVGGGLAGCSAAAVLAERGAKVTVLEAEGFLGGRVGAWSDRLRDGTPIEMERGFHAFFRQYYNLRAFLRRIDPSLAGLYPLQDYGLLGPDGIRESFARLPPAPPASIAALTWRSPTLRSRELLGIRATLAFELLRYAPDRTFALYDDMTARAFLDALRLPAKARLMLFDIFAHSFFNPMEEMSAAEMLKMFHFYFTGNPDGLVFDVLRRPFSKGLWDPMRAHLEGLGVSFRLNAPVERLEREGSSWRVAVRGADRAPPLAPADGVVLAVTVPALQAIVNASPHLGDAAWRRQVLALEMTRPFAVWRLWLDRPPAAHREPFVATSGLGLLENITALHVFQDEAWAWASRTGGSVMEVHAYALEAGLTEEAVRRDLWAQLVKLYPELAPARIVEERFLWRQDCPGFGTGAWSRRPTPETPDRSVALAGDFVKLPVPGALMEGAVLSGILAANHLLEAHGVRGAAYQSVPSSGVLQRSPARSRRRALEGRPA